MRGSLKPQTAKRVGINAHPTKWRHALGNWVGNQSACCPTVGWALVAHAFFVRRQPETAKRVGINAHPTTRRHVLGNWVGHQSACCSAVGWALAAHAFRVPRQPETANRTGIPVQNPSFQPTGVRARGAAVGIHRSVNPSNRFISF